MTGSRAGVLLSLLALVVAFIAFFRRHLPRRAGIAGALAGGAAVALVLLQLMGAGVSARFDLEGLADEGRLETYKATLRMIADHPWLGTGQGTFAYAFPAYRSPNVSLWGVWDMAHNTLLEIAADMGVPLAALVVGGLDRSLCGAGSGGVGPPRWIGRPGRGPRRRDTRRPSLADRFFPADTRIRDCRAVSFRRWLGAVIPETGGRAWAADLRLGGTIPPGSAIEAGGDGVRYRHVGPIGGLIITSVFPALVVVLGRAIALARHCSSC